MLWLFKRSVRWYRTAGTVVIVLGVPSTFGTWLDQGALWGAGVLFAHLYLGLTVAFMLPWLQRRMQAQGRI